jgi:hypothetical protein
MTRDDACVSGHGPPAPVALKKIKFFLKKKSIIIKLIKNLLKNFIEKIWLKNLINNK